MSFRAWNALNALWCLGCVAVLILVPVPARFGWLPYIAWPATVLILALSVAGLTVWRE